MQLTALLAAAIMLASAGSGVLATLDPCSSNTKGACPSSPGCSATRTSTDIQAAECAHNTRTHDTQTFAVFTTDHDKDDNHGAPYGTCEAYTCTAPTTAEMSNDADCWTFFWDDSGSSSGVGTGCIRDPETGECGCEDSDGSWHVGSSDCT